MYKRRVDEQTHVAYTVNSVNVAVVAGWSMEKRYLYGMILCDMNVRSEIAYIFFLRLLSTIKIFTNKNSIFICSVR